jgi:hypothetical protein
MHSLTPLSVAKSLKINLSHYMQMEVGHTVPNHDITGRLMHIYGCTSDYLLFGIMLGLKPELFKRLNEGALGSLSASQLSDFYTGIKGPANLQKEQYARNRANG